MIIDTSHLLVGVNSAANFFLYYLLRKNFRDATWRLLTCKGAVHKPRGHIFGIFDPLTPSWTLLKKFPSKNVASHFPDIFYILQDAKFSKNGELKTLYI